MLKWIVLSILVTLVQSATNVCPGTGVWSDGACITAKACIAAGNLPFAGVCRADCSAFKARKSECENLDHEMRILLEEENKQIA